jgi:FMN-dependent NADH-azoreductase
LLRGELKSTGRRSRDDQSIEEFTRIICRTAFAQRQLSQLVVTMDLRESNVRTLNRAIVMQSEMPASEDAQGTPRGRRDASRRHRIVTEFSAANEMAQPVLPEFDLVHIRSTWAANAHVT